MPLRTGPGFAALLDRIENNGVRTVVVEDVSRFAREMKAHVLGIALLRERGVRLLSAADGQDLTEGTDEMTEGMVTIMAVFAQIEKKRLIKKLRAARDRKSAQQGATNRRTQKLLVKLSQTSYAQQSASLMATARNGFPSAPFRRGSMRWATRPVRAARYQPPKSNVSSMLIEF